MVKHHLKSIIFLSKVNVLVYFDVMKVLTSVRTKREL